jgi:hypothetical protein
MGSRVDNPLTGSVVVIAWGSLINKPGTLESHLTGEWHCGPELPIALARISGLQSVNSDERRITRVIKEGASMEKTMVRPFEPGTSMLDATNAVQKREGTNQNNIWFFNFTQQEGGTFKHRCPNAQVFEILCAWGKANGVAGVVLTGLESNIEFPDEYVGLGLPRGFQNRSNVIVKKLAGDMVLLANTQAYIRLIPENMRFALEKRILEGDLRLVPTRGV